MGTVSFRSRRAKKDDGPSGGGNVPTNTVPRTLLVGGDERLEALADLWRSVLKVDGVDVDDNFFEMGGTSLHAMLMASRVEARMDAEVSLVDFFEDPTFGGLCRAVTPIE